MAILLIQAPYLNLPWFLHLKSLFFGYDLLSVNTILGASPWLSGKEPTCNAGDSGLISGSGIFPEEGNDNQLKYSYLGNPMDRGAWWASP